MTTNWTLPMAMNGIPTLVTAAETAGSGRPPDDVDANDDDAPSRLATSLGATVMLVFLLEGLIGNLWILMAVLTTRRVWNVINVFITSLCINDVLSLCLVVALIVDSYVRRAWTAGPTLCRLNPEFTVAFTGCSLWHTALIAIHRYVVVCHNGAYKRMPKEAYVLAVLLLTRLIPVACTVPGFVVAASSSGYVPKLLRCILLPSQKVRIISVTFVQILTPCLVVVLCYALIFTYVTRLSRRLHGPNQPLQREIQITKMFGMIFLMILVGFVPYAAVRNADRHNTYSGDVYVVVSVFYGIATCSNPIVYGAMSTEIRTTCWQALQRLCVSLRCGRLLPCLGAAGGSAETVIVHLEMDEKGPLKMASSPSEKPTRATQLLCASDCHSGANGSTSKLVNV